MTKLLAGYGEATLTPPLGLELSGYGFYLRRKATGVLDDLKARALFLGETGIDDPERLLIMACDLAGFSVAFADELRAAVAAEAGIERRQVLLSCTHTHTGPAAMPLLGIGEVDEAYRTSLPDRLKAAARAAAADLAEAEAAYSETTIEPIGFNRGTMTFEGIDAAVKVLAVKRRDSRVLVLGYACHPVTLGRSPLISSDWPGAAVRELESRGERALVLQGFCGDVDPVTGLDAWGSGTEEDLRLYGRILAERALKAAGSPEPCAPVVRTAERRLRVMLRVHPEHFLEREAVEFTRLNAGIPGAERFAGEWLEAARARLDEIGRRPYVDDVPVQAGAIGGVRIAGLPGEAFSCTGLTLRKEFPRLIPAGYVNGDIGCFPPAAAFLDPRDDAARSAPKSYQLFPFSRGVEALMLDAARSVLGATSQ